MTIQNKLALTGVRVRDGLGAPQCPWLQTVLKEKIKFPQLGQVQSPSLREADSNKEKKNNLSAS